MFIKPKSVFGLLNLVYFQLSNGPSKLKQAAEYSFVRSFLPACMRACVQSSNSVIECQ